MFYSSNPCDLCIDTKQFLIPLQITLIDSRILHLDCFVCKTRVAEHAVLVMDEVECEHCPDNSGLVLNCRYHLRGPLMAIEDDAEMLTIKCYVPDCQLTLVQFHIS